MDKKNEHVEDLPVESEQASKVKGGIIVQRGVVDPNDRSFTDPNTRAIIVQNPGA